MSPLLVAGAVLLVGRYLLGVSTDRWATVRVPSTRVATFLAALGLVLLEVNQQSHAALLMASN